MLKSKSAFILILSLLTANVRAQSKLSYGDFLRNVSENHPAAIRSENLKRFGEVQLRASQGNFDPQVYGSYDNKFFKNIEYYTYSEAEVKQQIYSAQYIKAGYEYGSGTFIDPERLTATYGLPFVGVELGLLQGMMIDKNRAEVMKARAYVDYYAAERNNLLNKLYYEASLNYFDWVFNVKKLSLNGYFLSLADQRLQGIDALAKIGERAAMDTIEAAIFLQARQIDYQNAMIDIQKSVNDLSSFNWIGEQPAAILSDFAPDDSLDIYYDKVVQKISQAILDTIDNPVINKFTSFQRVLDVDVRLKREYIKPKLNVSYNILSSDPTIFTGTLTTNNYKWGLNFAVPLYLRQSRNEYRLSKITSRNNSLELANVRTELQYKISANLASIQLLSEQIINADRSARYSKALVEAERLKFENGESSLFLLNTRESKWLESELKLAEYKLKYIQLYFQLVYLKGQRKYAV